MRDIKRENVSVSKEKKNLSLSWPLNNIELTISKVMTEGEEKCSEILQPSINKHSRSFVRKWCIFSFKFPLYHQNEKFQCEFCLPSLTFEQFELKLYLSFASNYIDVKTISTALFIFLKKWISKFHQISIMYLNIWALVQIAMMWSL